MPLPGIGGRLSKFAEFVLTGSNVRKSAMSGGPGAGAPSTPCRPRLNEHLVLCLRTSHAWPSGSPCSNAHKASSDCTLLCVQERAGGMSPGVASTSSTNARSALHDIGLQVHPSWAGGSTNASLAVTCASVVAAIIPHCCQPPSALTLVASAAVRQLSPRKYSMRRQHTCSGIYTAS